jgi:trehalose 6-phosphate phosphatase
MSGEGLGPLGVMAEDPRASAVLTDYDGTLAPIVDDPELAKPFREVPEILARLSDRFAVVGVVSGRPAEFLATTLGGAGGTVHLVGVYGAEWVENGQVRRVPQLDAWAGTLRDLVQTARAEAPPSLGIEDKGVSVTLHWRKAPATAEWANSFAHQWARRTGMVVRPGRMAVELAPPLGLDKGTVVERLAEGCKAVCFLGDDVGDLDAFAALDRLAAKGARTVRVAVADRESPPELAELADVVVSGPAEVVVLLERLADAASRTP